MSWTPCDAAADHQGAADPWLKTPALMNVRAPSFVYIGAQSPTSGLTGVISCSIRPEDVAPR